MILSSVYMPQGGSPQRSKGLKRKGPVLINCARRKYTFRWPNHDPRRTDQCNLHTHVIDDKNKSLDRCARPHARPEHARVEPETMWLPHCPGVAP
eukprot:scaffold8119_cov104-Phaeocystis_antarctica.AAC.2